ncbi:hypothetical protein COT82_00235 [Candidatus Campbellbacteria bacterium CG10_big_fil_rev_8_21_14_0_10_35_52]|uniref:Methyltransferase domain-containing protein n=1 Tax=Candidatus Campbellbacteria bacterium CG10_big_fil_rev_8_21_14_0_10_35_52 TaxID=1974527 RepID=A0A2M6WW66_9BACT|nr:MAG: hypothetical protein COT82_00235 [Candidatus Campbellbacteria bacterium CG10_big_fil_rev_8_21_14_0_10_35_52]
MFSNPKNNIIHLGLKRGMRVADFGVGSGHYTILASEIVGDEGRIYAIDIQDELLRKIKNLSVSEHRYNIDILHGDIEKIGGAKLGDNTIDAVIFTNILFQIEKKNNAIAEIKRVLKIKGKIMIVDWMDSFKGIGPEAKNIVTESEAEKLFTENGFEFVERFDAGEHHYGFIFMKA